MLQKTIRILIYPNITYPKNLLKDSFVDVTLKFINQLNAIRKDLFFHIMLPERLDIFDMDNVEQILIKLPTFPNRMRVHFDTFELMDKLPDDIDIVFSHLPEHTLQLSNLIFNKTQLRPEIIGYCHWFELDNVSPEHNVFNLNMLGLLEMSKCYLNTEYQKQLVIKQASEYFNAETIDKLNNILEVFYLGAEQKDLVQNVNSNPKKIIVFNHRPDKYKHFNEFLAVTDELYSKRRDFEVWVPLLPESCRSYVRVDKFTDKLGYYQFLSTCLVGVSPKQTYGGWSVATLDGLMNAIPYIMFDADYYKELYNASDCFKTRSQCVDLLEKYLDDSNYRNCQAKACLKHVSDNLIYEQSIKRLSNLIDECVTNLESKANPQSTMIASFVDLVKTKGVISKQELVKTLGWGEAIGFTWVKRKVMKDYPIYDTGQAQATYVYGTNQVIQKNLF